MLMQLVEAADSVEPDWQDALRRAGYLGRRFPRRRQLLRPRLVLVVIALALAVLYSVSAVAQERWWWVTSPNDPARPVTQVVSVGPWSIKELMITSGDVAAAPTTSVTTLGTRVAVQAYVSKEHSLCVGIGPDPMPRDGGWGIGCGFPVRGLAPPGVSSEKLHWVGYVAGIPGKVTATSPKFVFGPAAPNVHSVDLENPYEGRTIRVRTQPLPDSLGVDARFWIVVLAPHELVHTIVPRDEDGSALEHWRLTMAV